MAKNKKHHIVPEPDSKITKPKLAFGTEESNVKVVIRVRPFIGREIKLKDKKCVKINDADNSIFINDGERAKQFTYDAIFDEKSTQDQIFENGPKQIIDKTLQGFNGCIFAYGQTGSGKTYTMYGNNKNPGIIYQANNYIQGYIKTNPQNKKYKLSVTFLEIYNEQLNDLLIDDECKHNEPLKIREDPIAGTYVEGVTRKEIKNAKDLRNILDFGQERRTVGATEMNAHSSRSHSILGLHLKITSKDHGIPQKATLYMIDLAGSERAGAANTGNNETSNKRLKEGTNINLSLSSLGMVIKALVEKHKHIPYRNSKLTRLLQDSLGGNSMTIMIANMSPAKSNFADSYSTLQFANRAKNIKNKATKYKDPKSRKIAELQHEIEQLRLQMEQFKQNCTCGAADCLYHPDEERHKTQQCGCIVM